MYNMIIIDDESLVLNYMTEFIGKEFPEINVEAAFFVSADALDYLKNNSVDIVLTDISMPEPTGIDIAEFCHNEMPDTIVIFLSAYREFEYAHSAIDYDVFDYILKPLSKQNLIDSLSSALTKLESRVTTPDYPSFTENEYILLCQEVFSDLICSCISDEDTLYEKLTSVGLSDKTAENPVCTFNLHIPNLNDSTENIKEKNALFESILNLTCQNTNEVFFAPIWYTKNRIEIIGISKSLYTTTDSIVSHFDVLVKNKLNESFNLTTNITITNEYPSMKSLLSERTESEVDADSKRIFLEYIEENYNNHISLDIASKHFNFSRVYFSVYYKKCTGENFSTTLSRVRINKAKELLKNPNAKITSVMREVGYNHSTHFYKTFKNIVGCSPAEYQKRYIEKQ
ncbi:MAG: response regulator [Clostridia bacterium]|nr:response regulator [Clostridia bacterium]